MFEHHRRTIKRTLGGFILIASLAVLTWPASSQSAQPSQGQQSGSEVTGRFTIIFNPEIRADLFLLDTQTGKVWALVRYTDVFGEPRVWLRMERLDSLEDRILWERAQTVRPDTTR